MFQASRKRKMDLAPAWECQLKSKLDWYHHHAIQASSFAFERCSLMARCSKQAKGGPSKTMKQNLGLYSTPEALQQYTRNAAASAILLAALLANLRLQECRRERHPW